MEHDQQAQPYDEQTNGSLSQQPQIHVVGADLIMEGGYESTKRRGMGGKLVVKCEGCDVRVHGSVFKTRIALFERELKVLKRRASTSTVSFLAFNRMLSDEQYLPNAKRSRYSQDVNDWDLSDVALGENDVGELQAAHRIESNGRAVIFYSKHSATIQGISHSIFKQIVEWAYTGSFRATSEDVCDLLRAATFFGIDRMKTKCEEYLADKITEQNCLELCALAELHSEPSGELYECVLKFIAENFAALSVTDKFVSFKCVASLKKFLADDNLNVGDEKEVFEFLVKWTEHDRANRTNHFDSLLGCVRFYQLSPRFFQNFVLKCDLITGSEEGRKRVESLKNKLLKFVCFRSSFAGTNCASFGSLFGGNDVDTPRAPVRDDTMIICVGGYGANILSSVEIFDPIQGRWRVATDEKRVRSGRYGMGVVCVGTRMFVVGGHDGKSLSTVECLDLVSGEWTELAPLKTARCGHALVALDEKWLYAIGGWSLGYLKSVERYDIEQNEWSEIAPLSSLRWGVAAAVYRGQIYAIGGDNGTTTNVCERFDPNANTWTPVAPMLHQRSWCGVAVVGDHLYAIGGYVANVHCERYNFAENKWAEMKSLSTPRRALGVAVVGSRIFAIGGQKKIDSVHDQALKTVEVYDTLTDEWTPSASLNKPRSKHLHHHENQTNAGEFQ